MKKKIYGVGVNDADYQVSDSSSGKEVRCQYYIQWKNMLARCYSSAYHKQNKTYIGCSVDPRWYSFMSFRSWMMEQDWEGNQLDKDIIIHGNKVYGPDTCMFVDRKTNIACRRITLYATYKGFWVRLSEFFKDDISLYGYASQRVTKGQLDICEILSEREYATSGKRVIWEGEDVALKDLCDQYGKDYDTIRSRLDKSGWSNSSLYACVIYDYNPYSLYDMVGEHGVRYQFNNMKEIADFMSEPVTVVSKYLNQCDDSLVTLKTLVSNHVEPIKQDTRKLYTINGVSKYKDEWLAFYENNDVRVSATMTRLGIPFVEAVKLPIQRVMRVRVNGEAMSVKQMWERHGIKPKLANSRKSHNNLTFKETLASYGVDSSNMEIIPI